MYCPALYWGNRAPPSGIRRNTARPGDELRQETTVPILVLAMRFGTPVSPDTDRRDPARATPRPRDLPLMARMRTDFTTRRGAAAARQLGGAAAALQWLRW